MARQPDDLRALLDDAAAVDPSASRLRGCTRIVVFGTGTSWHAAAVGAWFLRSSGVDAWAVPSEQSSLVFDGGGLGGAGVIAISHSGASGSSAKAARKIATGSIESRSRELGFPLVTIGAREVSGADIETVPRETSSAHTASHLAAIVRLAQLGGALGTPLDGLDRAPDLVADALATDDPAVYPPARLIEFVGAGVNAVTAAEGALKVRETARIASEGLGAEQCIHGPLVALDERDVLVALNDGTSVSARVHDVVTLAKGQGARVHVLRAPDDAGPLLSVFPLTVAVQRIALSCAQALGTDPDAFGFDVPGRREAWSAVPL